MMIGIHSWFIPTVGRAFDTYFISDLEWQIYFVSDCNTNS